MVTSLGGLLRWLGGYFTGWFVEMARWLLHWVVIYFTQSAVTFFGFCIC